MHLLEQIEAVLEEQVRPLLRSHGGELRLEGYDDGVVSITLLGACVGCPSAELSTRGLIEGFLCAALPEVRRVEVVHLVDRALLDFARQLMQGEEKS